MRAHIRQATAVLAVLILLVGYAPAAPAAQIVRGGTLTHAFNMTVPTMDPHTNSLPYHAVYENIFDSLLRLQIGDPKTWEQRVVGVLAESWTQPDAKTIVFKLRRGVKFHDGSDFDADIAKWNLLRAKDHPKSMLKSSLESIAAVNVLDKYTVEVKAKNDNAALLRVLAFTNAGQVRMMSKAAFDKNGETWCQRNPVGTGPFKLKQWITDDQVILERNPDYFLKGADGKPLPYLDGVVMRYIPDPTVSLMNMRAGTVHLLEFLALKDVDTVKNDPNLAFVELPWAGQGYFTLEMNVETGPFKDVRVRQAALYGIDRAGMWKTLGYGVGQPYAYPYWNPGSLGYDERINKYDYSPDKVRQLLRDAGYPDGISIELKAIAREPENSIGEYVQQMWTAVGIKTKLVSLERLAWIDAMRAKNFHAGFSRASHWSAVDPELTRAMIACGAPSNWAQFCDKDVDRLLDEGLATIDPKKRADTYHQLWQIIQDRAYTGVGFLAPAVGAYRKEVQGLDFDFQTPNLSATWLK